MSHAPRLHNPDDMDVRANLTEIADDTDVSVMHKPVKLILYHSYSCTLTYETNKTNDIDVGVGSPKMGQWGKMGLLFKLFIKKHMSCVNKRLWSQ